MPELLAPAGSMEALRAAVAAGADAVYLGGKRFGARQLAPNFTPDEMQEAVDFAHLRGVKVYVTVNTLVREEEIPGAAQYLLSLFLMGVDGVILQDGGLLSVARRALPGLALHASTQCTIATPEGVLWAASAGYTRVILAREVTLPELDEILAIPPEKRPGLEVFIHGALCYSYSGQCLLSSLIGRRSGNRGMCAQPCRKPYRLVRVTPGRGTGRKTVQEIRTQGQYLLSPRDICCYPALPEVVGRRIDALKIEGRMRSPTYVAVVVSAYRRALDAIRQNRDFFNPLDLETMALAYSRDFCGGYLLSNGPVMAREAPGNRGLSLGRVTSVVPGKGFVVHPGAQTKPSAGDGLLVLSPGGKRQQGLVIARDAVRRRDGLFIPLARGGVRPGDLVFLTRSRTCAEMAREIGRKMQGRHPVPVSLHVRISRGEPVQWSASLLHPRRGSMHVGGLSGAVPPAARTRPVLVETIREQLKKTGDSPFSFRDITVDSKGEFFFPLSAINQVRREILARLEAEWTAGFRPPAADVKRARACIQAIVDEVVRPPAVSPPLSRDGGAPALTVLCATLDELGAACRAGSDAVCFEPSAGYGGRDEISLVMDGAAACRAAGVEFTWKFPRVAPVGYLKRVLPNLPGLFRSGGMRVMVEDLGLAEAVHARVPAIEVRGGTGLNIWNAESALFLHPPLAGFTLSPELSLPDIAALVLHSRVRSPRIWFEVICQGNIEAMVSRNRLLSETVGDAPEKEGEWYSLADGTGRIFPVFEDAEGRTRILNAVELTLIDYVPALTAAGINSLAIDARRRGPDYVQAVTSAYRAARDATREKRYTTALCSRLKEGIKEVARGGITAGYFRTPPGRDHDSTAE
ncbi:MAG: DUF3656 domain-containing protein [Methanolinea sp.]|nr:DUF3656 domain-containing protein [Methanolinea sp.]